jgi:hypothetical protein
MNAPEKPPVTGLRSLTRQQFYSILAVSEHGLRCPRCGRFRREEDFGRQRTCHPIPNGRVTLSAACRYCIEGRP